MHRFAPAPTKTKLSQYQHCKLPGVAGVCLYDINQDTPTLKHRSVIERFAETLPKYTLVLLVIYKELVGYYENYTEMKVVS